MQREPLKACEINVQLITHAVPKSIILRCPYSVSNKLDGYMNIFIL
jgi:hypothetical protein